MVTTIQIHEDVKESLDKLKDNKKSYEEVILVLMQSFEKQKRQQKELLIEGYKEMAEDSLKICKEWEAVDAELNCEWNEDKN